MDLFDFVPSRSFNFSLLLLFPLRWTLEFVVMGYYNLSYAFRKRCPHSSFLHLLLILFGYLNQREF